MAENEITTGIEVGLGSPSPIHLKWSAQVSRRWSDRGEAVLNQVASEVGGSDRLSDLLEANPDLDALLMRAAMAGAATAYEDKRRALARAVAQAAIDSAVIDESALTVDVISQLEAVHVRALELIASAEERARSEGDLGAVAFGAEKPLTQQVSQAVEGVPDPVLRRLQGEGLLDASINWDGRAHVSGLTSMGQAILDELREVSPED
ncbi:hypothetical protein ASD11_04540 [Aeromicrobium sp. Root495]|uniref:hypothetical protein n=1 Tax=Aeromicrobium sp. Root495 TaxID=1736550 RepID=UPI0006FED8C0|nr:hypothetical protein [Aeromicrobium sp. Root495]KQY58901.1 hypothetical protein ASD11_04540 [Aeromicrobium sp. Root495]